MMPASVLRMLCAAWLLPAGAVLNGQVLAKFRTVPERDYNPNRVFSLSETETVDNVTGALSLAFPIATLPEGRGGLAALSLRYSSAIYETQLNRDTTDLTGAATESHILQAAGAWTYSTTYEILQETRPTDSNCAVPATTEDQRRLRYWLRLPDGSRHLLRLYRPPEHGDKPGAFSDANGDGFYAYYMNGNPGACSNTINPPPPNLYNQGTTWFTTDGSFIRVEYQDVADCNPDSKPGVQIFFKDGLKVKGCSFVGSVIEDRNNNKVTLSGTLPPPSLGLGGTLTIKDSYARQITLQYGTGGDASPDLISYPGPNGTVTAKVYRRNTRVGGFGYQCNLYKTCQICDTDNCPQELPSSNGFNVPSLFITNVYRIEYPESAAGRGRLRYDFDYGETTTCPPIAPANCFWGELRQWSLATLKSGVTTNHYTVNYTFKYDGTYRNPGYGDIELNLAPVDNPVTKKTLTYTAKYDSTASVETEETHYFFGDTFSEVKSYADSNNNGTSPYLLTRTEFYDPRVLSNYAHGSVHTIRRADGPTTTRTYAQDLPFNTSSTDSGNAFVQTESIAYPGTGAASKSVSQDKNGNTTATEEEDWVSRGGAILRKMITSYVVNAPASSATPSSTDATSYWHPSAPRVLDSVATSEIKTGANTVVAASQYCYDAGGNRLLEASWDSTKTAYVPGSNLADCATLTPASNAIGAAWSYDTYGNVVAMTSPRGVLTTIGRSVCSLPSSEQVAGFAFARLYNHDCNTGLLMSEVDPNVQTTSYHYDDLRRLTNITEAGLRATSIEYDDELRCVQTRSDVSAGDGRKRAFAHYDPLGRARLSRLTDVATASCSDETVGIKLQRRYRYDTSSSSTLSGRRWELVSNPYETAQSNTADTSALSQDSLQGWTLTRRDRAGRIERVQHFDGSAAPAPWGSSAASTGATQIAYAENATTTTDPASKTRTTAVDGLGRLIQVVETGVANTEYVYDALGNLTEVRQKTDSGQGAPNVVRTFTYSSLSRLLSAASPETAQLPTHYAYDADGNLAGRKDPREKVTCFGDYQGGSQALVPCVPQYDNLSRPTRKTYSDATPAVTYEYDSASVANSKGRLTKVITPASEYNVLSYDALGRIIQHKQVTNGDYVFLYGYNQQDTLTNVTYPSGRQIAYATDGLSRVTSVTGTKSSIQKVYADSFTYSPHGDVHAFRLGNWHNQTCFNSRLQPTLIRRGMAAQNDCEELPNDALRIAYTYGGASNNGNPDSQTVQRPHGSNAAYVTWSQTYGYDGYNRLRSVLETGGPSQTYAYDRVGNRAIVSGSYTPTTTMSPTVTADSEAAVAAVFPNNRWTGNNHDTAGNVVDLVLQNGQSYEHDAENRMTSATVPQQAGGTVTTTYSYDGNGRRVKKVVGTAETIFVYDATGNLAAEYGPTPAGGGTQYLTQDTLGSTRLVSDANGAQVKCYDYLPFGEEISGSVGGRSNSCFPTGEYPAAAGLVNQKFTGKERDAESGLDYFGARYFSGAQGRFTSVDPENASASLFHPQAWNAYSYALNNPYKYIDPDGEVPLLVTGAIGAGIGAAGGAGFNLVSQLINSGGDFSQVDYRQVGSAALGGAVQGGLAGLTLGVGTAAVGIGEAALATGAANVVGGIVTRGTNELLGVPPAANAPSEGTSIAVDFAMGALGGAHGARKANVRYPLPNVRRELAIIANSNRRSLRAERASAFLQSADRQQIKNSVISSTFGTAVTNFFSDFFFRAANVFNPPPVRAKKKKDYETDITITYDLPK